MSDETKALDTLIERVRGLEGPDREVDGEVWRCIHGDAPRGLKYGNVPKLTASLDAVVSLIERELPGRLREIFERALAECKTLDDMANFVRILLAVALTAMKEKGE